MTEALEKTEGTVTAVVFRNEENGYTILRISPPTGDEVTVVGCMPGVAPGEGLVISGRWIQHPTYGQQMKAQVVERVMPTGAKAIFEFLASGAIKGVGAITAQRMVEQFGERALEVLEEDPQQLTAIKGVTLKRAREMTAAYRQQMGMRRLLEFLQKSSLPAELALPLYRRHGGFALEILKQNPYILVDAELGIPFQSADALAISMGMDGADPQRLEAGLLFELVHNSGNGHTFLPRTKLLEATAQLVRVETDPLADALAELIRRGEVVEETVAGVVAIYLADLHLAEEYVATRLGEMSQEILLPPKDLDKILEQIQVEQGITYAPQQCRAVELAAQSQVMLLTGGPGTGKTTSLRGVLALFEALGLETALAAPTGRAAKRMGETCGTEAFTIHRLLETHFDDATGRLTFTHDQSDPLEADAVIVDETSMVDITLMYALLSALKSDCRLVLVGDPDQLPSVGPGALLADMLRSDQLPAVALNQVFRQAAESAIVCNAHQVNQGNPPVLKNQGGDFFFLRRGEASRTVETIVELVSTRLPQNMGIPSNQIQVLTPTRKYTVGTANLNRALQQALNPPAEGKGERAYGTIIFREGDRVMQVKNNYDILWSDTQRHTSGLGIFNGDIGQILVVEAGSGGITVEFDGRSVVYTPDMLGELEPAYAITVHKAQGSEYPAVVFAAADGPPMLMTRGVLYTAITRARTLFVAVGEEEVLVHMAANNRQQKRYSALWARLAPR